MFLNNWFCVYYFACNYKLNLNIRNFKIEKFLINNKQTINVLVTPLGILKFVVQVIKRIPE